MARVVHFNLYLDKNRMDGGFAGTSWYWTDASANPPNWQPLATANTSETDSGMLQTGDLVRVAIGEQLNDGTTTTVAGHTRGRVRQPTDTGSDQLSVLHGHPSQVPLRRENR